MLNPFSNRKLLKRGERAEARIVEMTQPENGPEPSNVEMLLEVNFRGVPYEVRDRWMVAGTEPISAGSQIWVAVDPENPERVAIDWRKTRTAYRERTDPRRKVLSGGVPVPVTKVRDVLEQANGRRVPAAESPPAEPDPPADPSSPPAEPDPGEAPTPEPVEPDPGEVPIEAPKPREPEPEPVLTKHERDLRAQNGSVVTAPPLIKAAAMPRRAAPKPAPAHKRRAAAAEEDLTSKLERLTALHDAGALTDGEFSAAKAHVLNGD